MIEGKRSQAISFDESSQTWAQTLAHKQPTACMIPQFARLLRSLMDKMHYLTAQVFFLCKLHSFFAAQKGFEPLFTHSKP